MISIIIPTYNSAKTINRCLDSIVAQTYKDYEVLVMDGVSKDDTLSLVQSYNDSRIRIYSKPDKGIYDAMNKGIKRAKGDWLYFLGSDDYLYDNHVLEEVANELSNRYDVVYGEVYAPQLTDKHRGEWELSQIEYNRCHQSIFYKKTLFKKYGLYSLKYPILADFAFNLRWLFDKSVNAKYINRIIADYSAGGTSDRKDDITFEQDYELLILKYGWRQLSSEEKRKWIKRAVHTSRYYKLWFRYICLKLLLLIHKDTVA